MRLAIVLIVAVSGSVLSADEGFNTPSKWQVILTPQPESIVSETCIEPVSEAAPRRISMAIPTASFDIDPKAFSIDPVKVTTHVRPDCWPCHSMSGKYPPSIYSRNGVSIELAYTNDPSPKIWNLKRHRLEQPEFVPFTHWTDGKGTMRYRFGPTSPDEIMTLILRNDPPLQLSGGDLELPVGAMPTISDDGLIREALYNLAKYVGNDAVIKLQLIRREGKESLPIDEQHTISDILGTSATLIIDITSKQKSLTVRHEMTFIPEELIRTESDKVGSPLLLVWTIVSFAQSIYDLLHPTVAIWLPPTIEITASLANGNAELSFGGSAPKVQIHWSFWMGLIQYEYNRALTGLVISPTKIDVQFHESRYYRDVSIPVKGKSSSTYFDDDEDPAELVGYDGPTPIDGFVGANSHPRSGRWNKVRDDYFADHPHCAFRGCKCDGPFAVHHIKPYHLYPELELDPNNLITVCAGGPHSPNHHLYVAHDGNYSTYNPDAVQQLADGVYPVRGKELFEKARERQQRQSKTTIAP